jgi:DNA repair protein RecO (recombination protein O)
MSGTYKATGINLKGMPFGESDRLLTVLTQEYGLLRAIAPGSRKHQSSLRGRSGLFVINQLLIAKGRNLDKIIQAESLESFPGLSQDLQRLTASQYLAELALYQALSDQPQEELFSLLRESLSLLEQLPVSKTLSCLLHATFQLLTLAGVAPQVHSCCATQEPLKPDWTVPTWRVGFSLAAGGTVTLAALEQLSTPAAMPIWTTADRLPSCRVAEPGAPEARQTANTDSSYRSAAQTQKLAQQRLYLDATELALLQQLTQPDFTQFDRGLWQDPEYPPPEQSHWISLERILRQCAEYYFERPIRSAALIDTCFQSFPQSLSS